LGRLKTFGKLLAQADLHLVLSRIDAVFSQASGLDIAVENSNVMPTLGKLLRSNIPAGPAPTTNTVFTQSSIAIGLAVHAGRPFGWCLIIL